MNALLKLIDGLTLWAARGAALALFALFALGLAEVVMRSGFGVSLDFALEYSGYLVALAFFWGSGWTLAPGGPGGPGGGGGAGSHIRMTLAFERLGERAARRLDLACSLTGLVLAGAMAVAMFAWALGTYARGTVSFYPSATPLAWPQFLLALGPGVLALAFLARLIRLWFETRERAE